MIPESQLHYIWANHLFHALTLDGESIEVRDAGQLNPYDGPDFSMAKISVSGMIWAGAIEIHRKASEWYDHHHDTDPRYCSVILHVVLDDNVSVLDADGRKVPTAILSVSPRIMTYLSRLQLENKSLRCMPELLEIGCDRILDKALELLPIRVEEKLEKLKRRSDTNHLNTLFYHTVMRYIGGLQNNDIMEQVAQQLPYAYLKKHATNIQALEAMLIGQASLFNPHPRDDYERALKEEYTFYRSKFSLTPIPPDSYTYLRLRPSSFPARMLGIVAALLHNEEALLSALTQLDKPKIIESLRQSPSEYWQLHFDFDRPLPHRLGGLGQNSINTLIINAVVPLSYHYAVTKGDESLALRVMDWLYTLPPENNQFIRLFVKNGVRCKNAAHTQSLLQLYHTYCEPFQCLKCPMANLLFKSYHDATNEHHDTGISN